MSEKISPSRFIVFNGDADGICAAHQLFLADQQEKKSITGVKRDISLLRQIEYVHDAEITVLDVAVEKNLPALKKLLEQNCDVRWFDHHLSPEIPEHPNFKRHIDTRPDINTSLLVSNHLNKGVSPWAVAGLYGDNMHPAAEALVRELNLEISEAEQLRELGELMNYNAYGGSVEDLFFPPAELLNKLQPFSDPLVFVREESVLEVLQNGRREDLEKANRAEQLAPNVVIFPNERWARRVIGIYANRLAQQEPDQAHAVLVKQENDQYVVSVRAPLNSGKNAAEFCRQFPTGGGRVKAAGINSLEATYLPEFTSKFSEYFQ